MVKVFQIDKPTFKFWRKVIISAFKSVSASALLVCLFFLCTFGTEINTYIASYMRRMIELFLIVFFETLIYTRVPYLYKIIFEDNSFTMFYYNYGIPFRKKMTYRRCAVIEYTHTTDYIIIGRKYAMAFSYVDIDINQGWSREQLDEIIGILQEHGVVITRQSLPYISTKRKRKK